MAGENYIGSVISLISLSDIRYVGTLHSINAQDSTVGLKQVRSYGTEGRRGKPEEEILPTDNVFDYVVFRGSDIKDLQVFEAPKPAFPQPQTNLPQDPAIMSMGYAPPMNPYNNMYPPPQQQQQQPPSNNNTYWQQPTPSAASAVPPPPAAFPPSTLEADEKAKQEQEALEELKAELEEADQPTINEAAIEELAKKVSEMNPAEDKVKVTSPPSTRRTNEYRGRGGRFNNNNNRQYNSNSKKEFTIPNSEFDFEASNAKFDKSEIKKEDDLDDSENEVEIPEPEEFYDKKSSFFDNISCESKERSEQQNEPRRNRFHEERKLNMETFGQATVDQSRYRNNFRGRGNSGYRNNRGGYYRNNNRNYNNNNNNNNYRQNNKSQQQDQD